MAEIGKTLQMRVMNLVTFLMLIALASATRREGIIKESKRNLGLLEPDVVIISNEILFKPGKEDRLPDGRVMFDYVVAEDYIDTLALIEAQDKSRQSAKLSNQRYNSSLSFY